MQFADKAFRAKAGYQTAAVAGALPVHPQLDENIAMARTANLLRHYTGSADYRRIAEHAAGYLTAEGVAENRGLLVGGILLVDYELANPPLHITIVGSKKDPQAQALHRAALALSPEYKRVEWLDRAEGPLPNGDVDYPGLPKAAAFVCTASTCSSPIMDPETLARKTASPAKN
jgi:uncharacterized protein